MAEARTRSSGAARHSQPDAIVARTSARAPATSRPACRPQCRRRAASSAVDLETGDGEAPLLARARAAARGLANLLAGAGGSLSSPRLPAQGRPGPARGRLPPHRGRASPYFRASCAASLRARRPRRGHRLSAVDAKPRACPVRTRASRPGDVPRRNARRGASGPYLRGGRARLPAAPVLSWYSAPPRSRRLSGR